MLHSQSGLDFFVQKEIISLRVQTKAFTHPGDRRGGWGSQKGPSSNQSINSFNCTAAKGINC